MTDKSICRTDGRCEYAIQSGAETEGSCPAGKCAMPCDNSAAHLTIPGALEWDGPLTCSYCNAETENPWHGSGMLDGVENRHIHACDNCRSNLPAHTHDIVGTHGADGESAQPVAYIDLHSKTMFPSNESVEKYLLPGRVATPLYAHADSAEVSRLRALLECSQGDMRQADQIMARQRVELDNLEQSRRSFFDLSQDLEKRLAERDAVLNQAYMALIGYLPGHRNDLTDAAIAACSAIVFPAEAKAACSRCGDWGHIETEDSAHDCPECGPSVVERAVEAWVMNEPKPYAAMSEAEADEFLSSFGGGSGSGNKAKRRIAEIEKAKQKPCAACDGWGTISTGIDEAPSTNCKKCDGTGKGGDQ